MNRTQVGRIWANNTSVARRDPGDAKYLTGWLAEIPTYQVLNYLQWKADTTILALAERGIMEWGTDVTYSLNSVVWDNATRRIYVCTVQSPNKTAPSSNPSQWTQSAMQIQRSLYDTLVNSINSHIANTNNPHKITPAIIGTYTKAEIDAMVAKYQAAVVTHENDKNNPHKVTATQIGAVPVSGGTYTGAVYFKSNLTFGSAGSLTNDGKNSKLTAATGFVNLDSSGNLTVGSGSTSSPVITDGSFPAEKMKYEPLYATQMPFLNVPFQGGISIHNGYGKLQFNSDPVFDSGTGVLLLQDNHGNFNTLCAATVRHTANLPAMTVVMDVKISQDTSKAAQNTFSVGLGYCRVYFNAGGKFWGWQNKGSSSATTISEQLANNEFARIAFSVTSNRISMYKNGVKIHGASTSVGWAYGEGDTRLIVTGEGGGGTSSTMNLSNVRFFDTELTAAQISRL